MKYIILLIAFYTFSNDMPGWMKLTLSGKYNNIEKTKNGVYLIRAVDSTCKRVTRKLIGHYTSLFSKTNYKKMIILQWKNEEYCGAVLQVHTRIKLGVYK